jgi:signal transduction histidine kinase
MRLGAALAGFVALVSECADEDGALRGAAERAAEVLHASSVVALVDGAVRASVGTPDAHTADAPLGDVPGDRLVVTRATPFTDDEADLLLAMAAVLGQAVRMTERQRLLEHLGRIQRSISHRAPLQEVLDAITQGALDLLGDEVVGLRLIDPEKPTEFMLVSHCGLTDDELAEAARGPVGQGAGGRAIAEDRLVIIDDYASESNAVPVLQANGLTTAMAAPVHENGRVVGSLVVASYTPGRHYSGIEQEALTSLAQHASLALTDAKTVEAMREAQRAKDMFLAMVSHELKTPLTVIQGTLRTLESHTGTLDPVLAREMVAAAYARGEELRRLIDRLLRGARAELAGARREARLRELVLASVDGFAQLHRLSVSIEDDVPLLLDTVAFADVVGILVENAVSHSAPDAPVWVTASPCGTDVYVSVTNPGTLPSDLDPASLFLPFQRGTDARSSGVGLGLYIAARLAESMGGSVDVEPGGGVVTFTLRVPRGGIAPPVPTKPPVALAS